MTLEKDNDIKEMIEQIGKRGTVIDHGTDKIRKEMKAIASRSNKGNGKKFVPYYKNQC